MSHGLVLQRLIQKLSIRRQKVTLSSGVESDVYLDLRQVSLHPQGANSIGHTFWETITEYQREESMENPAALAGVAMGGIPLVTATTLAAYQGGSMVPGLMVRKEAKAYGMGNLVEGSYKEGDVVYLLEDVVTSGKSVVAAITSLRSVGLDVRAVFSVVDREAGGASLIREQGVYYQPLFLLGNLLSRM